MNIQSLIGKFKRSNTRKSQLTIVVQPSALFFSSIPGLSIPQQVAYEGASWQDTLHKVLKGAGASDLSVDVVLHSNLYQSYQIEKPSIPDEELASALPFLLKDLITEKVTEIVADYRPLPMGNKLQVYVIPRSLVVSLSGQLSQLNIALERVLIEDDVWAYSAGELSQFLLLQRSKKGQFRVSAFSEGQCAFQRTIRGVASPLTGVASSALQLDGLALELQRSIDYLSSQLRSTPLHQMKVCCDEEEQQEVAQALSERLSVGVTVLSERGNESGVLLVESAALLSEGAINLFPSLLKPKKDYFTLTNIAIGWGVTAIALLVFYALFSYQQLALQEELRLVRSQEAEFRQQVDTLNQRLAKHKPSPTKVAAVSRLELEIESKRQSLDAVSEYDIAQQVGYSGVMRSLAKLGRDDISLSSITIDTDALDLKGLAREPQVIPNWISQFKTELDLVGRTFDKLKIGRNDQDIITFELKTKEGTK
jgi:MSHA biogenesis protein MshI